MHYHLPQCKFLPTYPSVPKYARQYLWLLLKLTERNNISNSKLCKLHILIRIIITHTQLMHHYSSSTDNKSFLKCSHACTPDSFMDCEGKTAKAFPQNNHTACFKTIWSVYCVKRNFTREVENIPSRFASCFYISRNVECILQ